MTMFAFLGDEPLPEKSILKKKFSLSRTFLSLLVDRHRGWRQISTLDHRESVHIHFNVMVL